MSGTCKHPYYDPTLSLGLNILSQAQSCAILLMDFSQAAFEDGSDFEEAPLTDTTRARTHPTFLGRTHRCVSGICGLLVATLTIV